jgi:hypothetical protein
MVAPLVTPVNRAMRRRRLFLSVGLLMLLAVAGLSAALLLQRRYTINQESFERLGLGMKREDVVQLLGGTPGDFTSARTKTLLFISSHAIVVPLGAEAWHGDRGGDYEVIWVVFDAQGRILDKGYDSIRLRPASLIEQMRSWLRL